MDGYAMMSTYSQTLPEKNSDGFRGRLVGVLSALILANLLAWGWALTAFAAQPVLMGTAVLAYSLGRSHRNHRQCGAQTDAGRQATGCCRALFRAWPFRRRDACLGRNRRDREVIHGRGRSLSQDRRHYWYVGFSAVSVHYRDRELDRVGWYLQGFSQSQER